MKGFTFIELLVVISIFSIMVTLGLFMSMETFRASIHRSEDSTIVSILQRARSRAMANIYQSPRSVCFDTTTKTYNILCTGSTCPSGTEDAIPAGQTVTVTGVPVCGAGAIVFEQLKGNVATPVTIIVSEPGRPDQTISINNEAAIIW